MIAAIVLAAGLSRRMGRAKLLLEIAGQPVIRHTVRALARAAPGVEDIVVVTGTEERRLQGALEGLAVRFIRNPRPEEGQGSSIAAGARALRPETRAAFVVLGDQPWIPATVFSTLIERLEQTGKPIVVPVYRGGTQGNPVLFGRAVFGELAALTGDAGGRGLVCARPDRVEHVTLDIDMPADLDTPEDYVRLAADPP
jgi:molybdenum cofactor cytidylyltransferase